MLILLGVYKMDSKELIFEQLKRLAACFDQEVTTVRLQVYTEELCNCNLVELTKALKGCVRTCNRFPSLKEILEKINPVNNPRDEANEMAGAIISCIRDFGRYRVEEVYSFLGPTGQMAIERFGGWELICNTEEDDLGTIRAQLRDLCLSVFNLADKAPKQNALPFQKRRITSLGNCFAKLLPTAEGVNHDN